MTVLGFDTNIHMPSSAKIGYPRDASVDKATTTSKTQARLLKYRPSLLSRSALLAFMICARWSSSLFLMGGSALTTTAASKRLIVQHIKCPALSSSCQDQCGRVRTNRLSLALFSTSRDNGSASPTTVAVPERKARHRKRGASPSPSLSSLSSRKKKKKTKTNARSSPLLTEQDVGHHVASLYVKGSGGIFHHTSARRKRMESSLRVYDTDPSHKEYFDHLKKLDGHPALVLNADYQPISMLPLSLWSWQEAIKAVFSGKVSVVDIYPDVHIRAVNIDVPLPSVIALNEYAPRINQKPAFTRRNVFLRDSYRCQYCAQYYRTSDLSLDHYIPRSHGGKLNWDNAVTCCRKCNGRKGSHLPNELSAIGMRVLREPRVPTNWELAAEAGKMLPRKVHPTWAPYLGLDVKEQLGPVPFSDDWKRRKTTRDDTLVKEDDNVRAIFEDVADF